MKGTSKTKIILLAIVFTIASFSESSCAEIEKFNPQDMVISAAGVKLIERFEGFRESVYVCPAEKPTVGFGHVVKESEAKKYAGTLSREEGSKLLLDYITAVYAPVVRRLVKVPLTQGQFDALTSFDYNVGADKWKGSTLLGLLNNMSYHQASLQFPIWRNAGGKYLPGLFKRRLAEMFIFRDSDEIPLDLATIPTKNQGENLLMVYHALRDDLKKEAQDIYWAYKKNTL